MPLLRLVVVVVVGIEDKGIIKKCSVGPNKLDREQLMKLEREQKLSVEGKKLNVSREKQKLGMEMGTLSISIIIIITTMTIKKNLKSITNAEVAAVAKASHQRKMKMSFTGTHILSPLILMLMVKLLMILGP